MRVRYLSLIAFLCCGQLGFSQTTQQIGTTTVAIDTLTTQMSVPWEIKVGSDNHLWVTERAGRVSRVNLSTGQKTVVLDITSTVHAVSESGLLGMAFHPNFGTTPEVFLVYTYGTEDVNGFFKEKLVKYTYNGSNLVNEVVLVDDILAWSNHNGSRLFFLPDNTLLMSTGECYQDYLAQDMNSPNGKYLRVNLDGSIPADNPDPGSYVFSSGHRNSQGICVLPNGKIIASEHGPTTDDELQVLEAGKNYGWPLIHGFCDENFEDTPCGTGLYQEPIHAWTPTIATSDLVYYQNTEFPEWNNRLIMTTLNGQRIVTMALDAGTTSVVDEDQYFQSQFGRLRDIAIGPNKELYIATNTGGSGHPIIRITPPSDLNVDESTTSSFLVVPNPAGSSIQLKTDKFANQIVIRDINGKVVLEFIHVASGEQLNISALSSGTYTIEAMFSGNEEMMRERFVK